MFIYNFFTENQIKKITAKEPVSQWAGSGLFLQNCFIFIASLIYKFGRTEDYI